jgi:uncharacterized membrane protein YfhO
VLDNSVLMDLLNVKYEISHATRSYVLRESYLPRAFIVPEYRMLKKEEVLDYLVESDFDPTRTVLFEKGTFDTDDQPRYFSEKPTQEGRVKIVSYRPDSVALETNSVRPGYLFLSDIFYPGWKAFLDGRPTRILRGNYLFRVIELPEGEHSVRLVFDPVSIKLGITITILTLILLLGIIGFHLGKKRKIR